MNYIVKTFAHSADWTWN